MREEVISSGGIVDPTPAASSAGASSPAGPFVGSLDGSIQGQGSKAASLSCVGSVPPRTSFGSSRSSCRPWERGDLLRRLATFEPSNWFGKPKLIGPLACAQKGWVNVEVDKIACETCNADLGFVLLPSWTPAEVQDASEAFAKDLDSGHKASCPWRGNSCPESLVQFPPAPQSALIGGYKDRCDGLLQFQSLPKVADSAIEQMRLSRGLQIDRFLSQTQNFIPGEIDFKPESIPELESSRDGTASLYSCAQKLISLCGWEPRWHLTVQDCEEHSAQSARNGNSLGPIQAHSQPGKKALSASAKKDTGKGKLLATEPRSEFKSPLLDCSLCGATVRIMDFLTVPQPARFSSSNIGIPDTSKKMTLTRGASAASGISGWVAADDAEKEHDEVATTNDVKLLPNADVELSLSMGGAGNFTRFGTKEMFESANEGEMGRDLMIGQPAGSEVGDRAASYESRGPSSRKRSLEIGGSSDDRQHRPRAQQHQADSVEGTVIDRDGDEVTDGGQYPKRPRETDYVLSPYHRDSGAGPSNPAQTRDSARASSVIAMDTVNHDSNEDSMESVENFPGGGGGGGGGGDMDDIQFPSSSTYGNLDMNDTSELNYSNPGQQSAGGLRGFAGGLFRGEIGVSSTNNNNNDGEEIFNAETATVTAPARERDRDRDGISFGISGGSVGMCASHEAEIHGGADVSVHRTNSVAGDVTGESAPGPGLMDEIIPDEINREDDDDDDGGRGDSQEMSQSMARADSGSKIGGSAKAAESVESGEKISLSSKFAHPSLSCNAKVDSGYDTTKQEVTKAGKSSSTNNFEYLDVDYGMANGIESEPPKGESNYEEAAEFDPIAHHNQFCPWVNANVAAAGGTGADVIALCGWQLTLDALDALQSLGPVAIQTVQSESAASLHKDDHQTPGKKLLRYDSMTRSQEQH